MIADCYERSHFCYRAVEWLARVRAESAHTEALEQAIDALSECLTEELTDDGYFRRGMISERRIAALEKDLEEAFDNAIYYHG